MHVESVVRSNAKMSVLSFFRFLFLVQCGPLTVLTHTNATVCDRFA